MQEDRKVTVCQHVLDGHKPERLFAHCGSVLGAFCIECQNSNREYSESDIPFDKQQLFSPYIALHQISAKQATALDIPLELPGREDEEATIYSAK